MADNKVTYLNRTFSEFKTNLINFTKTYFPNSYNDFSDANPGALFIELSSYIGDVTSFYTDTQIQETFLLRAKEKENLFAISYAYGYTPKMSYASVVSVDIYQLIPSKILLGNTVPNYDYALKVNENTQIQSSSKNSKFLTISSIDFNDKDNTEITYVDANYFLLKKTVKAISAEIKTKTFNFSTPNKFQNVVINDEKILQILDASDINNNKWYEVPYLAQSSIQKQTPNPNFSTDGVPYLINYEKSPRRFVSRFMSNNIMQIEFGAGISNTSDETILPTPDNIELGLIPGVSNILNNYNKANTLFTQEYGLAPSDDITIRYLVGGGIESNVPSNDLTIIDKTNTTFPSGIIDSMAVYIKDSLASTNPQPSSGGKNGDEIEEIRNNALYAYQSQLRAVTAEDYRVRALSMPSNFGSIAKVYVTQDPSRELIPTNTISSIEQRNALSLDMYVLSYDSKKNIKQSSDTLKQNLVKYIDKYRMVTDAINIKDAFYINIGINFDIKIKASYNNNDVITKCIIALKEYFNIDKWNINQPINLSDITSILLQTDGVQNVIKLEIINKQDTNGILYSRYAYDIFGATRQNNIYPSLDPSIFEIKYPDIDISGRCISY